MLYEMMFLEYSLEALYEFFYMVCFYMLQEINHLSSYPLTPTEENPAGMFYICAHSPHQKVVLACAVYSAGEATHHGDISCERTSVRSRCLLDPLSSLTALQ